MTLDELILPSYAQMLEALSGQLDKAKDEWEGAGKSIDTLMAARLAPDMFPLSAQVQFVCIQAEEAMGRLFDHEIEAVDAPQSFAQAKDLISQTIARLRAASGDDRQVDESRAIELKLSEKMIFDLDLREYVRNWSVPQFYFHLVAAYAIMRHHGTNLGKSDYVPHIFQYLRKEQ